MLIRNLLVGLPTLLACMALQVAFAYWGVRYYVGRASRATAEGSRIGLLPVMGVVLLLFVGAVLQIAVWGLLFMAIGEFDEFYEAVYHSAVNFSSLGYGDVVMSRPWKLLGPLEACCGVLMLGMTAGALMAVLQHMIKVHGALLRDARP